MSKLRLKAVWFVLPIPIYNLSLLVSFGYDKSRTEAIIQHLGGDGSCLGTDNYYAGCAAHEANSNRFVLHIPKQIPERNEDYGELQHEIRHLTDYMLAHVGMSFHLDYSSEAYAYLTGYLTEEIYGRIWSWT